MPDIHHVPPGGQVDIQGCEYGLSAGMWMRPAAPGAPPLYSFRQLDVAEYHQGEQPLPPPPTDRVLRCVVNGLPVTTYSDKPFTVMISYAGGTAQLTPPEPGVQAEGAQFSGVSRYEVTGTRPGDFRARCNIEPRRHAAQAAGQ